MTKMRYHPEDFAGTEPTDTTEWVPCCVEGAIGFYPDGSVCMAWTDPDLDEVTVREHLPQEYVWDVPSLKRHAAAMNNENDGAQEIKDHNVESLFHIWVNRVWATEHAYETIDWEKMGESPLEDDK